MHFYSLQLHYRGYFAKAPRTLKQLTVSDLGSDRHIPSLSSNQWLIKDSINCVLAQKESSIANSLRDTSTGLSLFSVLFRWQTKVFWHMTHNWDWPALCAFQVPKELRKCLGCIRYSINSSYLGCISYSINSSYHDGAISNDDTAWVNVDATRNKEDYK